MSESETRRRPKQKRSLQKVEQILDTVDALVVSGQIDAITTTQVAAATGFAVGTIYQYFSNRTDLLMAAHDRMLERSAAQVTEAVSTVDFSDDDSVDRMIRLYVETAKSVPGYLTLLQFAYMNQSVEHSGAKVEATIGDAIHHYIVAADPDADAEKINISKRIIVNLLSFLTDIVLLEEDPQRQEQYLREMIAHCRFALARVASRDSD